MHVYFSRESVCFSALCTHNMAPHVRLFFCTQYGLALLWLNSFLSRTDTESPNNNGVWGGRGAEGVGRVTAVRIFIAVEENDYCNMYYQVSRLRPSGESYEKELSDERAHNIKKNIILAKGLLKEGGQYVNL